MKLQDLLLLKDFAYEQWQTHGRWESGDSREDEQRKQIYWKRVFGITEKINKIIDDEIENLEDNR